MIATRSDGVVAKRLNKPWWYVGTTATIDKMLKTPIPKFILLVGTLTSYILDKVSII